MSEVNYAGQDLTIARMEWQTAVAERNQAREELASVNEELRVLNEEVADQNLELRQLNDELAGLCSTTIPVVMVDRNFAVRRIAPAAEHPFNLRPGDIGRLITDIRLRIDGGVVKDLISRVLDGSAAQETELLDYDGEWRLLAVRPYRIGHRIEGATLTLLGLERMRGNTLEALVEFMPTPVLVLNSEFRITAASRDFVTFFGLAFPAVIGRHISELARNTFACLAFKAALARLAAGQSESEELETIETPESGGSPPRMAAKRVEHTNGHQFLIALHDITASRPAHRMWANALIQTEEALRVSHRELRDLTARLLHAQDEERRRLSRELHDDLSQNVAALQLDLEALAKKLPLELEAERRKLTSIGDSAEQLANDIRRIARGLHPSTLEVLGLSDALRTYTEAFTQRTRIQVEFSATNVPGFIPPEIAGSLYRIAQEALRNVARHVGAGTASVHLAGGDSMLALSIRDNGPGFEREEVRGRGGLGLVTMEERARLIRATFQVDTAPGKGVAITVSAPMTSKS